MVKLTPRLRIELIEYHEKTGGTLLSTARKYNVTITAVHKILKNKSAVVKRYNEGKDGRAKRFSLSEHAVLDSEVAKWYAKQQQQSGFEGVTKWDLRRIVNSVAREYKLDFNVTGAWLKEFAKKNGVVLKVVSRKSDVLLNFGKTKVSPKKLGRFSFKNTKDNSVNNKDATVKDISTSKTLVVDQGKVEKNYGARNQESTGTSDTPKDLNVNLKRNNNNLLKSQCKNNKIEEIDNLKNNSKEYQSKKQKLGLSSSLKIGYKKVKGATKVVSNLRVFARNPVSNLRRNVSSALNLNTNDVVPKIKQNKGGRPRKIPLIPKTEKTIPPQSFYNHTSRSLVGIPNLTPNSDNIAEIKPKIDSDAARVVSNENNVVGKVATIFKTSESNGNCSLVQVVKKKVGRPKRVTVSPNKDLSDIIAAVDVTLKATNAVNYSPIDVLIRRNKAGCGKGADLRPQRDQHSIQGVLDVSSNTKVNPIALQSNNKRRGRPKKIVLKPGITNIVSKIRKNNLKQSLKLKVTRLTSKGQWKVKRGAARDKNEEKSHNGDKDKGLDKRPSRNRSVANQANLINDIPSKTLIKEEEKCGIISNDTETSDNKTDVFEFKDEFSGILPIKRKRKTIINLKPKKIAPIRECSGRENKALSVAAKLNIPTVFEERNNNQKEVEEKMYVPDNKKINPLSIPSNKVPKKRGRKSKNISTKNIETNSSIDPDDVKPGFEENISLELTPKKPRAKSNSFTKNRSKRRSSRISQNITSSDESEKDIKHFQKLAQSRVSGNSCKTGVYKDQEDHDEDLADTKMDKTSRDLIEDNDTANNDDDYYDEYSYEYENGFKNNDNVDLDETDYCVAVENGNIVEITVDRSKELDEKMPEENYKYQNTPKIDIISDIKISSGLRTVLKRDHRSSSSSYVLNTSFKEMTTRTMETQTSEPPSPTEQNQHPLNESWSNLFPELESDLSADELVTKINEIDFQYDSDPFKDVKIQVHSGYEGEEEESNEYEDYEYEDDDDGPSSQGQPMLPPNQMQQPPNNMQNSYRPPMPPNGRAPAPRGPQPGVPRMPGGPRGPQMNPRAPGARPRAPMVRPRGAGATPVRGQMRPRMTGPQNGIRPTNQTSPAKRIPEQNNAMQAKRKKLDVLTPSDKDDDDCQVICMQPKNTDGGLPQIESVQGAESVENSIMHLSDSITLSVRNPPPKPVVSPVKSDAKAVANILATRGITVTASAKSKESTSPVKQAPALPTALSLNGAVSIVASKNANGGAKPAATETLPTVDLTDDSGPAGSPSKNRPGLPYRCDLCPAQYPNAMGLNKHRQTYHKTNSGMCELGVPLINIKQPGIMQKLSQMGINNYIPLPSAGPEGTYALPIISTKNPGNMTNLGATQMLSLGPVRTIPRPGVSNNTNAAKK